MTKTETKTKATTKPKPKAKAKAPTKVPTKAELAKKARGEKALKSIKADAAEVAKSEKNIIRLQNRMGKTAMTARRNGVKFNAIADAANRSVAWVQTALASAGYEPREYSKNE